MKRKVILEKQCQCKWSTKTQIESDYHNTEWGVPVNLDDVHFEFITLEAAQAGLSWLTILNKRQNYQIAFNNFNIKQVSQFTQSDVLRLLENKGIVRHKQKINSTINNAQCFIQIEKEFGSFNKYIWKFVDFNPINNNWEDESQVPSSTILSDIISKDLKKRGFKFVGSTTIYAYMQASGLVNDHVTSCFRHKDILEAQKVFRTKT
ncbi:MAG: DNA-3-methyladenine glycosylase I [Campylobacteraceae bacterium]|nr:DNA-3-methyladenine glycosylase I [Campylobacteraceae bacterium]